MSAEQKRRTAILCSGSGSNFEALVSAGREQGLGYEPTVMLCNKPGAGCFERAERLGVQAELVDHKLYKGREAFEAKVIEVLDGHGVELVALAGFMRILTPLLVDHYAGRMLNIHPSLLPAFPGAHGIRDALEYGVKVTGPTVHLVTADCDGGPIVIQRAVEVADGDDEDSLAQKIHAAEHAIYPIALDRLARGQLVVNGRTVTVSDPE